MTQPSRSPLFRAAAPVPRRVAVTLDGRAAALPEGMPLAAALLAEGVAVTGISPVRGEPRGPLCLMGTCLQCLLMVDGVAIRACRATVRQGMAIERVLTALPPSPREIGGD